jgi:outer membrane lipoprotein LolB
VIRRVILPLLAAAALAACATPSPPPAAGPLSWTSGRLSVRIAASAEQPAQSLTAAFELRGDGDAGELRLNSPLGTRMATARWGSGLAELSTADGERRFGSLDELSRRTLGEVLPLAALPDWLAGRPWPQAPHRQLADGFEQLGWRVLQAGRADGWVEAHREAPPAVALRVRLDSPEEAS